MDCTSCKLGPLDEMVWCLIACMAKKTGSTLYKRRERTLPVVNVKLPFASFLGYDSFSKDGCEVKTEQNISGGCQCIVL